MHSESVEFIQFLLQIDFRKTKITKKGGHRYPQGLLCTRKEFPVFWDMVNYLIEEDHSKEVIEDSISGAISVYEDNMIKRCNGIPTEPDKQNTYNLIELLLKANPEALQSHLLFRICRSMDSQIYLKLLSLFMSFNENAVKAAAEFNDFDLIVHCTAQNSTVEVLEFLLEKYPEAGTIPNEQGMNILHFAIKDDKNSVDTVDAKNQISIG